MLRLRVDYAQVRRPLALGAKRQRFIFGNDAEHLNAVQTSAYKISNSGGGNILCQQLNWRRPLPFRCS